MVVEGEKKEVGMEEEKEEEEEDERDAASGLSSLKNQEGVGGCRLSLDEEPDVGAGSNVSNCTLLVHDR